MVKTKTPTGYNVPVLDSEGIFIGTKVICGDDTTTLVAEVAHIGNGSRGARRCLPRDGKVAVGRKKKWGRK